MMEPPPAFRISGMAALVPRKTPLALTSITLSQSSRGTSSTLRLTLPMPALFTRMSSLPNRATVADMPFCQSDSLVTSSGTNKA